jgi:sec-independent protein translocase protein TatC
MPRPFDDGKMSFLEHLGELRTRIVWSLIPTIVGLLIAFRFSDKMLLYMRRPLDKVGVQLVALTPTEAFWTSMKVSMVAGVVMAMPVILWQVWAFIAPGLYPGEKAWAVPFIAMGSVFFVGGAAFGHFYLFPVTFRFLGGFGGSDMQFLPKIDEYFSFYSWFLLGLGVVFQLPVIIFVLSRIGLVTAAFLLRQFKWAVLGAFIIAAILTPTPDMVTQTLLALPMIGLYLLGVLVAWLFGKPRSVESTSAISADVRT